MFARLAPVDRQFIKNKVQSGEFVSEIEVVRAALRKMREEDLSLQQQEFEAAILAGDRQIEAGETIPYTEELMNQIFENAKKEVERKANNK